MNIIDAWKKASYGCNIARNGKHDPAYMQHIKRSENDFEKFLKELSFTWIVADDWEVVKEKKTVVLEGVVWKDYNGYAYPSQTKFDKVYLNWNDLIGKTTKLTIEYEE